jgi:hypothetical protein
MREKQPEPDDRVKLEPILDIKPGVYLTVLYTITLLLIFFLVFVNPGIKKPAAALYVKTEPAGAAIRLDGVYMGISGERIPIQGGKYLIEAVMPGFETQSASFEIPGRVFFSLFFPRRFDAELTLKTNDPAAVFAQSAADFAAWSFGGEPTSTWQIPLSLSEGAYRIGPVKTAETEEILAAASRFTVTRAALRDLSRAKILMDNGGLSPSPPALASSVSDILVFLSENQGSAQWLSALLPPESASIVRSSNWLKNDSVYEAVIIPAFGSTMRRIDISGMAFIDIPEGKVIGSKEESTLKSFLISENHVTRSLFETFLNENPQWMNEYTDYYEEEISVIPSEIFNREIVSGITWYAADAFCQWLTKRLPPSYSGYEARLPTEIEWEYAAMFGIRSMEDPIWEWCADPFAPLQFIAASRNAIQAAGSPERALRGRPSATAEETRACLPPDLSSPFVTFRPVISLKAAE